MSLPPDGYGFTWLHQALWFFLPCHARSVLPALLVKKKIAAGDAMSLSQWFHDHQVMTPSCRATALALAADWTTHLQPYVDMLPPDSWNLFTQILPTALLQRITSRVDRLRGLGPLRQRH